MLDRSPFTTYTRRFGAQSVHALALGRAGVAELVDAQVLGTCGAIRGGSIPSARTTCANHARKLAVRLAKDSRRL